MFSIQAQKSNKHSQFSINSLSCIKEKYRQKGISSEITEVIIQSWKSETQNKYVVRCVIWYHLYNLKNMKNTHAGFSLQLY